MSDYSPFDTQIGDLKASDLGILSTVSEGWYIEYKSQLPSASSIAKSVSAFANTYGGWLFYGISEKSKAEAVAGTFVGIDRNGVDAALQTVRHAISHSLNPQPFFETKVLWGPEPAVGLEKDKAVICIKVPRGFAAPYVHKSGVIYRRVGDGSEPKAENDRFVLDQLWRRGDEVRKEYKHWLERSPEFSKGEGEMPYFRIFITPDLWRERDIWANLSISRARQILSETGAEDTIFSTPFDTVYRTNRGFVGRQIKGNNPHNLTATWHLNQNLTSQLVLPLPLLRDVSLQKLNTELEGYANVTTFLQALRKHGHVECDIIDLNFIFAALVGAMHIQSRLSETVSDCGSLFVKCQLMNVWRTRPFLDVDQVVSYQLENGVPVCLSSDVFAPSGTDPEDFRAIPEFDDIKEVKIRKFFQAMYAFQPIAAAFGIETGLEEMTESGVGSHIYLELIDAANRASEAQRLRNERRGSN
jgi:Putative DNA-binding domain